MTPEELAQKLADYFNPPHYEDKRRTDLKPKELRELPWEERYERVFIQAKPDSSTMIVNHNSEGAYITSLSFLDITLALEKIKEESETQENKE